MRLLSTLLFISIFSWGFAQDQGRLPITKTMPLQNNNHRLIFMISGDGGWTSFDQGLATAFAQNGYMVAGLDARKYFWSAKNPDSVSRELFNTIGQYMTNYKKDAFLLVGYSFGGCIVPFLVSRTPAQLHPHLKGMIALSPEPKGDFEIHLTNMLGLGSPSERYNVVDEIKKLKGVRKICVFGERESAINTQLFRSTDADIVVLPGGHHYQETYINIVSRILKKL